MATWICNICEGKEFSSKQAFDAHVATKRHKRNLKEAAPEDVVDSGQAVDTLQKPCATDDATDASILEVLLLPAEYSQFLRPLRHTVLPENATISSSVANVPAYASLSMHDWYRILGMLDVIAIMAAAHGFFSAAILRSHGFGDRELWTSLVEYFWPESTGAERLRQNGKNSSAGILPPSWYLFLQLAKGTARCRNFVTTCGVDNTRIICESLSICASSSKDLDSSSKQTNLLSYALDNDECITNACAAVGFECAVDTITARKGLAAAAAKSSSEVRLLEMSEGTLRRLPPLPRRQRDDVNLLALPARQDVDLLAVAEYGGNVWLENISGDWEYSGADAGQQLLWDAVPKGCPCNSLCWLPNSPAICCEWGTRVALFDASRPTQPLTSTENELKGRTLVHHTCLALLIDPHGSIRTWDFRTSPSPFTSHSGLSVSAVAVDPVRLGVAVAAATNNGLSMWYSDLRKGSGPEYSWMILRDRYNNGKRWSANISIGLAGEVNAIVNFEGETSSLAASFVGGAKMRCLGAWQSNMKCTAWTSETLDTPQLVAIARPFAHIGKLAPAEIRQVCHRQKNQLVDSSSLLATKSRKPKPKKMKRTPGFNSMRAAHFGSSGCGVR